MSVCVAVSQIKYLKEQLTDFDEIFSGLGRGPRNNRFDFGGDPDPFSILSQLFIAVMHFQTDSNSLLLFARWKRMYALYRVLFGSSVFLSFNAVLIIA